MDEESSPSPPSPPTLSHRDMARPPHEDPEYQRQIVGSYRQGLLSMTQTCIKPPLPATVAMTSGGVSGPIAAATLLHHTYSWSSTSPVSKNLYWKIIFILKTFFMYFFFLLIMYVCSIEWVA